MSRVHGEKLGLLYMWMHTRPFFRPAMNCAQLIIAGS